MITVANKKARFRPMPQDVYIGRPGPFGNPFEIGRDGDRAQVIELYRRHLSQRIKVERDQVLIKTLINIPDDARLVCWCAPLACHGDILAKVIPWLKKHQSEYLD